MSKKPELSKAGALKAALNIYMQHRTPEQHVLIGQAAQRLLSLSMAALEADGGDE